MILENMNLDEDESKTIPDETLMNYLSLESSSALFKDYVIYYPHY